MIFHVTGNSRDNCLWRWCYCTRSLSYLFKPLSRRVIFKWTHFAIGTVSEALAGQCALKHLCIRHTWPASDTCPHCNLLSPACLQWLPYSWGCVSHRCSFLRQHPLFWLATQYGWSVPGASSWPWSTPTWKHVWKVYFSQHVTPQTQWGLFLSVSDCSSLWFAAWRFAYQNNPEEFAYWVGASTFFFFLSFINLSIYLALCMPSEEA